MDDKVQLDFVTISQRLAACELPDVDRVVGIGSGGVVLAALAAYKCTRPLTILSINYRAPDNTPRHPQPRQLAPLHIPANDKRLLLVDDVSVSGQTLQLAKSLLADYHITTLVLKGQADHVLFPEIAACVHWPWQTANK